MQMGMGKMSKTGGAKTKDLELEDSIPKKNSRSDTEKFGVID